MSIPVIAFFNNKGGVGKTSLVYHLAWMYADLGTRVVVADLDPQANLTAAFLDEDRLEELWPEGDHPYTIFGGVQPLMKGIGDIAEPYLEKNVGNLSGFFPDQLALLVGDLLLSSFEDQLSEVWPKCSDGDERAFRVMSAFWRIMQKAATNHRADLILVDLGPNLGAINRAALIAADYVVVPLSPDLFSLQGLRNLGPALRRWRQQWKERLGKNPVADLPLPTGERMQPIGYVVLQHSVRLDRPVKAYDRWIGRIPEVYQTNVLSKPQNGHISIKDDPNCLILLKHYRSLMPMAQEAHKPMFNLKPADGAIGAHFQAVQGVYHDFERLALKIAKRAKIANSF
jgi:cellulose biosynthesis protein BcsQ